MHTYTSTLTSKELKDAITEYCIHMDLHPRLSPSGLTMDKLPSRYIRIYIEHLEQGGLRIPFSTFFLAVIKHFGVHVSQRVSMGVNRVILFEIRCRSLDIPSTVSLFRVFYKLCKQGHLFSFENKTGGRSKKCFKEVTSNTDVRDDFPNNYNEEHAERLATPIVLLRPPHRHLLYLCGLTTTCRHPDLRHVIKDSEGQGNKYRGVSLFIITNLRLRFLSLLCLQTFSRSDLHGRLLATSGMKWDDREQNQGACPGKPTFSVSCNSSPGRRRPDS
ncbi:hypothetical protein Tco_1174894 [Tanacetum coccineum]